MSDHDPPPPQDGRSGSGRRPNPGTPDTPGFDELFEPVEPASGPRTASGEAASAGGPRRAKPAAATPPANSAEHTAATGPAASVPPPSSAAAGAPAGAPPAVDPWAPQGLSEQDKARHRAQRAERRRARRAEEAEQSGVGFELGSFAELATLTGWAIVQPVLSPYGESPETFVGAGASGRDVVVFALLVAIVPLVVLSALAAATRVFGATVRRVVQTGLVAVLGGLGTVALARSQDVGTAGRVLAAVAVGAGLAAIHRWWHPGRLFLRYAAITPIILVMTFLVASPVSNLVSPPDREPIETAPSSRADHPDVVVLVFDELPTLSLVDGDGQIDSQRFPNFARFADTSTWFRNHSTVSPETLLALPALTTGKFPIYGSNEPYADAASYPDNIFSLLGPSYDVQAEEWATDLCPASVCSEEATDLSGPARKLIQADIDPPEPVGPLLDSARSLWLKQTWPFGDGAKPGFSFPGSEDSVELAKPGLEFLSSLEPAGDRPVFDWLDVGLPHQPWRLLPSGGQYNGPEAPAGSQLLGFPAGTTGNQLALAARTNHLLQLQWTDRFLGAVLDRLDEIDRFSDALVMVTADHGVAFSPGEPLRDLVPSNAEQISYAPLLVKAPGQRRGSIDDGNALSLDLLPTVADYANVDLTWEADGQSLRDGATRTDPAKLTVAVHPEPFTTARVFADVVRIDADGLGAIKASPFVAEGATTGLGDDGLNVYRHGRFGSLIGQRVEDLKVCDGGPKVNYQPPSGWDAWADGSFDVNSQKLPLFHHGTVDAPGSRDVVLAVDGVVAGWAPSRPDEAGNPFDILLAEPVADAAKGAGAEPVAYEVGLVRDCQLRQLRT